MCARCTPLIIPCSKNLGVCPALAPERRRPSAASTPRGREVMVMLMVMLMLMVMVMVMLTVMWEAMVTVMNQSDV